MITIISGTLDPVLSQMNPAHTIISSLFGIRIIISIILLSVRRSSKLSFAFRFFV